MRDETRNNLPDGWHWTRLGSVCERQTGTRDPCREPGRQFIYVDITSVDNRLKGIVEPKTLNTEDAPSRARQIIRAGDVLVATTRPNLNAVAIVPPELDNQICSTGFCVLRATDQIDSRFLFLYVQNAEFVEALSELVKGALYPAVTDGQVRAQWIPLPPLPEQRRITTILTEQMAALERAREALEAQEVSSLQLVEAYLRESLADTLQRLPLSECLIEVTRGIGASWNEYPLLGVSRAGLSPAKEPVGKSPERYKPVEPGTIFYNPMRILLGSIALVDDGDPPGIASPDYVVFKTRSGLLHHRWFYYWLRSSYGEVFIKTLARGAVRERMLFRRLVEAAIDVPAWQTQKEVATKLQWIACLRQNLAQQLEAINRLPALLLQKAFSGEL